MYIKHEKVSKFEYYFQRCVWTIPCSIFWFAIIMIPACMINMGNWVDGQWWDNLLGYSFTIIGTILGWRSSDRILKSINSYAEPYTKFNYPA